MSMTDLRSPEEVAWDIYHAFSKDATSRLGRLNGSEAAIIRADREQVERDTIRKVVEWLRDVLDPLDADHEGWLATWVADRIEAGEWKQ